MALKENCSENKERKRWKKDKNDDDNKGKRGKTEKTSKSKCEFHGKELLGPYASLRVIPCPPVPNHIRGEVIRPPSQIINNSYSVIQTRDLDDLTCTRCTPTITSRPSGMSVQRVFKYRVGEEGEEVCVTGSAMERFWSRIKEMNHKKS